MTNSVANITELRQSIGSAGDVILLAGYVGGNNTGGGMLTWLDDTSTLDDGGVFYRVNSNGGWKRNVAQGIMADWFGVTGDGVDCGEAVLTAINYVVSNGGILQFPQGEVNIGTTRIEITTMNGPSFIIRGQGHGSTHITWDNVDPIAMDINTGNYTSETALLKFGADPTGYGRGDRFASITIEDLSFSYTRQANKGGNTYETMGVGPHPTPYSCGTTMLDIWGSYHPIVRNCRFEDCWGNAIRFRKCNTPIVQNCMILDVSANEILGRQNSSEALDSFGSGIFLWACWGGVVSDTTIWNTKVYVCDESLIAANGQVYNGTLVGYIGCFTEYGPIVGDSYISVPPSVTYFTDEEGNKTDYSINIQFSTFTRVTVYGYVIGFKSESASIVALNDCTGLNCYMPVLNAAQMYINGGYFDMLGAYKIKSPQNGYETQRAVVCNPALSGYSPTNKFECRNATIVAYSYRATMHCKGEHYMESCKIYLYKSAALSDNLTTNTVYLLSFNNNQIFIDSNRTTGQLIRNSACEHIVFNGNRVYNTSSVVAMLGTSDGISSWDVADNHFYGVCALNLSNAYNSVFQSNEADNLFYISASNTKGLIIRNNKFTVPNGGAFSPVIINHCYNVEVSNNQFYISQDTVMSADRYLISCSNNRSIFLKISDNSCLNNNQQFGS